MSNPVMTEGDVDYSNPDIQTRPRQNFQGGDLNFLKLAGGDMRRVWLIEPKVKKINVHKTLMKIKYDANQKGGTKGKVRCLAAKGTCPMCEISKYLMTVDPPAGKRFSPDNYFFTKAIEFELMKGVPVMENGLPKFRVIIWTFGQDKFLAIRAIQDMYKDLRKQDLVVSCGTGAQDAQFQKLSIIPCPDMLAAIPGFFPKILEVYKNHTVDLMTLLGTLYDPDEALHRIGIYETFVTKGYDMAQLSTIVGPAVFESLKRKYAEQKGFAAPAGASSQAPAPAPSFPTAAAFAPAAQPTSLPASAPVNVSPNIAPAFNPAPTSGAAPWAAATAAPSSVAPAVVSPAMTAPSPAANPTGTISALDDILAQIDGLK